MFVFFCGSPFNKVKYEALLEGLEITERRLSELNENKRFEAEFFLKKYTTLFEKLSKHKLVPLSELVEVPIQTGHTPPMKNLDYYGGEVKFIKTDNLRINDIREPFTDTLSELGNDNIKRTQLKEGDIITTIIGATYDIIARSCIVSKDLLPANINQNIVRIRMKDIPSGYVCCYLNSECGRMNLEYLARQMEQVNLNCDEVGQVLIPIFDKSFQESINNAYIKATNKRIESRKKFKEAVEYLNKLFKIHDYKISKEHTVVRGLSTIKNNNRFDAEYYMPEYNDYVDMIKKCNKDWDYVKNVCDFEDTNFVPDDKTVYKYIELSNIGSYGDITGCTESEGWDLPSRARRKVRKGDVIISSVEGSLDSSAIVTEEFDGSLCSTGFFVIHSDVLSSEVLICLFKSEPLMKLLKKGCSGTILSAISRDEFDKIPLPVLSVDSQKRITKLIKESIKLRNESLEILDNAEKMIDKKLCN